MPSTFEFQELKTVFKSSVQSENNESTQLFEYKLYNN